MERQTRPKGRTKRRGSNEPVDFEFEVIPVVRSSGSETLDEDEPPQDPAVVNAERAEALRAALAEAEQRETELAEGPTKAATLAAQTFLTYAEAAALARVSTRTIRRKVKDGELKAVAPTRGSRLPRIRRSDLDEWLRIQTEHEAVAPRKGPRRPRPSSPTVAALREAFARAKSSPRKRT